MWTDGRADAVSQGPLATLPSAPSADLRETSPRKRAEVHTAHAPGGSVALRPIPERRKLRAAPEDHLDDGIRASLRSSRFG